MPAAPDATGATEGRSGRRLVGPAGALAGLVVAAAVAYVAYALQATVPLFLLDELYYLEAGTSVALGDGLRLRDQAWGYEPRYPAPPTTWCVRSAASRGRPRSSPSISSCDG